MRPWVSKWWPCEPICFHFGPVGRAATMKGGEVRDALGNVAGEILYVVGGLAITASAWGSWWAAISAMFTGGWVILLIQRVTRQRKRKAEVWRLSGMPA